MQSMNCCMYGSFVIHSQMPPGPDHSGIRWSHIYAPNVVENDGNERACLQ